MENRSSPGFTLIEILVVVMIIGILAAIGMAQYSKAVENSKADQAASVAQSIANANRSFFLDKSQYVSGDISACDPGNSTQDSCNGASACDLMYCNYLARQDLRNKPYQYLAANPGGSINGSAATATRRKGSDSCGCGTDVAPFTGWGYNVTSAGVVTALGGAPPPP